ncbi:uncharacterized protein LOC8280121 isoform X2 [Ricinus communis]|uniref:uncharacterized protein LOC8280121 isoform X2 n=1 Tax=Ricinus communis TaxID=3988 RepID=UPI00201A6672|nr:uncharacterized protein LOC8280121 isoform X2 [Ricinus communis]
MGSSGSKVSSSSGKGKGCSVKLFHSCYCLGLPSECRDRRNNGDNDQVCDHMSKENEGNASSTGQTKRELEQAKIESYRKVKGEQSDETCVSSNVDLDEWRQASITNAASRVGSSSTRDASGPALTSQSSFLSRFSFVPGNVSFRLSRATSLGSSRGYCNSSTNLQMLNEKKGICLHPRSGNGVIDGNGAQQSSDLLPASLINRTHRVYHEDTDPSLQPNNGASDSLDNNRGNQTISSSHDARREGGSTRVWIDGTSHSPRIFSDSDSFETRMSDRRTGAQEPADSNVRFSRTLSVGRLRDRVLRRSSLSDVTSCPLQQERQLRDVFQVIGRQALGGETRVSESEGDGLNSPTTYPPSSSTHDHELETTRSRASRYHDLLEHRSNFLERRRRIRSQVGALQRLGSRFENLSGHERSCILSGHYRTGRCTCHATNQDANLNDDTSARASISRIVILAEALFEQSAVLSSQPSISSLGSIPAPKEVVDRLTVKLYTKSQKHQNEDTAQCYICLVEYEEGDSMRILPCHHEFHRTCIDKWLKEIHRLCPLCRGDVCSPDSFPSKN